MGSIPLDCNTLYSNDTSICIALNPVISSLYHLVQYSYCNNSICIVLNLSRDIPGGFSLLVSWETKGGKVVPHEIR